MTFLKKMRLLLFEVVSWIVPFSIAKKYLPKKFIVYGHLVSDGDHPVSRRYQYPNFLEFDRFINEFMALGYEFCSLTDYMKNDNKKKILLTFDDGFKMIYDQLHPYMMDRKLPYAIFVLTEPLRDAGFYFNPITPEDLLNGNRIFLSATEILKLKDDGVYIGFHTRTHHRINDDYTLDGSVIENEMSISTEFSVLFSEPFGFAYPFAAPKAYDRFEAKFDSQFDYFFDTRGFVKGSKKHHFRVSLDSALGASRRVGVSIKRQLIYSKIKQWLSNDHHEGN